MSRRPTLCMATFDDDAGRHVCMSKSDHLGPHSCDVEEHTERQAWDEYDWYDVPCPVMWPSSPRQMRMGSWTIEQARIGDVIGDARWSLDEYLTVEYVGRRLMVGSTNDGREVAQRFSDFHWKIIDMEEA